MASRSRRRVRHSGRMVRGLTLFVVLAAAVASAGTVLAWQLALRSAVEMPVLWTGVEVT